MIFVIGLIAFNVGVAMGLTLPSPRTVKAIILMRLLIIGGLCAMLYALVSP